MAFNDRALAGSGAGIGRKSLVTARQPEPDRSHRGAGSFEPGQNLVLAGKFT